MTVSPWRKSTRCSANNGCVELAVDGHQVAVRDGKDRDGSPVLGFGRAGFSAFLARTKAAS